MSSTGSVPDLSCLHKIYTDSQVAELTSLHGFSTSLTSNRGLSPVKVWEESLVPCQTSEGEKTGEDRGEASHEPRILLVSGESLCRLYIWWRGRVSAKLRDFTSLEDMMKMIRMGRDGSIQWPGCEGPRIWCLIQYECFEKSEWPSLKLLWTVLLSFYSH